MVPVAADGTKFHRALKRNGHFVIGKKGEELRVSDFEAALRFLKSMPKACWRRPNKNGNWGIVTAVRWEAE
jgi:hypothetical protein